MALSYPMRLACVIVLSMGLLHLVFELLVALGAPLALRLMESLALRRRERLLYRAQLAPFALAIGFSAFFSAQYIANESNFAPERVGWPSLLCAATLLAWWAWTLASGVRMAVRTMRFSRACRPAGLEGETPIVAAPDATPRVALVGLLHPFVFISKSLLDAGGLDPIALEVVLDHERSHAVHRDNWKLLSLYCLPRLNPRLRRGSTWMQLWQHTAEWAADEDAVRGSSDRALVLAETLIALARSSAAPGPTLACTYFACEDTELAQRIALLIDRSPRPAAASSHRRTVLFWLLALGMAVVLVDCAAVFHDLPEHLLHLG